MRKGMRIFLCLSWAIALMALFPVGNARAGQESMTLTTFYPAPFGAYDRIRLVPRAAQINPCDAGTMYFHNGDLYVCGLGGVGGPGTTLNNYWEQNGNELYPLDWNTVTVGIGTNNPDTSKKLHVRGVTFLEGNTAIEGNVDITANGDLNVEGDTIVDGKLGVGKTPGNQRALDVNGNGQMDRLYLKVGSDPVGEMKVQYISAGADSGYYAVYAP